MPHAFRPPPMVALITTATAAAVVAGCLIVGASGAEFAVFKLLYDLTNQFNGSIPDTTQFRSAYDFIVIGSGSGGSVVANRLTEQRDWSVLLLEAGDEESFISDVPLTPGATQITRYNWGYRTERQPGRACTGLLDGRCNWPKGRALGGTSVINFLIYQRGHRRDFDGWAAAGNPGWSYADVLPYFIKSERNGIESLRDSPYHGRDGYLDVQYAGYKTELVDAFIAAGGEYGYGNTDPNGERLLGVGRAQATMRHGRRCSAAKAFLRPVIERSNLEIAMNARVLRILIDAETRRAYGVEFVKERKRYRVLARKEVILSAGTIASPQLLMLSGVGPREDLTRLGVPVVQDLRVGYNLQDHVAFNGLEFLVNRSVTVSEANVQRPVHILNYLYNGRGPYTIPGGAEALAFVKTWNSSYPADYPDIEIVIGAGGLGADRSGTLRNMLGLTDEFYYKVYRNVMGQPAFGLVPVLLRPQSRGRISLKSRNPFHWPRMEPNFYTDRSRSDLKRLIEGVRMAIQLAQAQSFKQFGTRLHDEPFPGCEPLPFQSDAYWECCIERYASSLQHQVGTCKMGPSSDPTAVVNAELQVHGVRGLRVVDASVMPTIVAGHTNAAVFMIGEKAADMIKAYWLTGAGRTDAARSENFVGFV